MRQIRQRKIEEEVDRDWWYGGMVGWWYGYRIVVSQMDSLTVRQTR